MRETRRVTVAVVAGAVLLLTWTAGMGAATTVPPTPSPVTPVQVQAR